VLTLPPCDGAPGLEEWVRNALAPYYVIASDAVVRAALADVARDVPILQGTPDATCTWAGRLGDVACWQLCGGTGSVVARAASAPHRDLRVPDMVVQAHPYAYHQSGIGSGPHFNGYILGDDLVGVINIERGRRLLLFVAEFPGAAVEDHAGYDDGESLLGRLHFA
jgi:hypothetical protein